MLSVYKRRKARQALQLIVLLRNSHYMTASFLTEQYPRIKKAALHLLFWLLVLTYFSWGFSALSNFRSSIGNIVFYLPGFMFLVYSLIYLLIPRYLIKKQYIKFFAGLLLLLALCMLYSQMIQTLVGTKVFNGFTMNKGRGILPYIHVAGIAISINLLNYWYRQKQQTVEALQQKTAAELELLKAQVHPHFLFNTLNNLYAHVLQQSPMAPEIVLKLSGLLRFMIYESDVPLIPLADEIKLLKEYISLEQLRYGNRLDLSLSVNGSMEGHTIPPLLVLPLVENAFKHGTSQQTDQCWISFDIHVTEEGLHFTLVNSRDPDAQQRLPLDGGIGLQNVQRRLHLLYPGRHRFTANHDKDVFIVNLHLQWDKAAASTAAPPKGLMPEPHEMEMPAGR